MGIQDSEDGNELDNGDSPAATGTASREANGKSRFEGRICGLHLQDVVSVEIRQRHVTKSAFHLSCLVDSKYPRRMPRLCRTIRSIKLDDPRVILNNPT